MPVELGPHQIKAMKEMKNGCILKGDVGTGKSRTALAYFYLRVAMGQIPINGKGTLGEPRSPRDLYIVTTAKKRDKKEWEGEAVDWRISTEPEHSLGGIALTVDSWNNIGKYENVRGAFFIFDEQRLVGSGAWVKSFWKVAKHNDWILLSATPGDTWLDYIPVFVANGFYKSRAEFVREHVVFKRWSKFPAVDYFIQTAKLERLRDSLTVDMPFSRHTKRHVRNIMVEYDKVLLDRVVKDRWHIYDDRPLNDVGEMFIVMRKLVNSDPSRLGATLQLIDKHPRLIIFYNHNHELETLRTLKNVINVPIAEWNGQKHQEIPEGDKWVYLVQYTAGAEGWNCIATDAMLMYSLNYSYRITEQAKGRIDRLNTPYVDLWYYMLRSNSLIDNMITKSLTLKEDFNVLRAAKDYVDSERCDCGHLVTSHDRGACTKCSCLNVTVSEMELAA